MCDFRIFGSLNVIIVCWYFAVLSIFLFFFSLASFCLLSSVCSPDNSLHRSHLFYMYRSLSILYELWNTFTCVALCSDFHVDFYLMMLISESFGWMGCTMGVFFALLWFAYSLFEFVFFCCFANTNGTKIFDVWNFARLSTRLLTRSLVRAKHIYNERWIPLYNLPHCSGGSTITFTELNRKKIVNISLSHLMFCEKLL